MPFSLWVLLLVLLLITLRQLAPWKLAIWHIMLGGGIIVLVARAISLPAAWDSIDSKYSIPIISFYETCQASYPSPGREPLPGSTMSPPTGHQKNCQRLAGLDYFWKWPPLRNTAQ